MNQSAYAALEKHFARRAGLQGALGILNWDSRTMMPAAASSARADQVAALEGAIHGALMDPAVADWLDRAESDAAHLDDWQRANLAEMRREHLLATAVPADLVEANARDAARCEMVWRTAKAENDFALLLPHMQRVLNHQREIAAANAAMLNCGLYDALHELYEPGSRVAEYGPVFNDYAAFLPGFLAEVEAVQAGEPKAEPFEGPFPVEAQRALVQRFAGILGFQGRVDQSLHAFCGGATGDVRITTRLDPDNFFKSLKSGLHEAGHALYEMGRPAAWTSQPVGQARGLGVHESQSLTFDMQVGRHPRFLEWLAPQLAEAFGREGDAWSAENLRRRFRRVDRTFIRVDADEVTYPAHVILRWRLEQALIEGQMELVDLPEAWNQGMRDLLGITPPDLAQGCLQDIHWPSGAWGYFPTYTLGAMMAAQLFQAASAAIPDLPDQIGRGDFRDLVTWLGDNVHRWGRYLSARDILIRATGKPLDAGIFKAHLRARYL
ncbi:carboxypeptidase M32 [Niveispirillum cyanobacteriorum]|uniref:Metal-dependent carboxypeptidase n=1 Tax=Niveispirillum cyanobacteriorum TaxID=1612173 RepID=A0A2K9NAC2_9PROT|nr:carboxypeptidase M32 [Niveispirillum cyanobacteriorum]AUN29952.1 carboxypeptidase M32 [Niveispirillum cyanobacteriorum]GGE59238.1 carboxypeptidase M32 [Niveispirillum cyanobacteriorum]